MAKEKISVTVDAAVLAATDADAKAAGLNRSEMIEQALRNEHLRAALQTYTTRTVPALDIDAYAQNSRPAARRRHGDGHRCRATRRHASTGTCAVASQRCAR